MEQGSPASRCARPLFVGGGTTVYRCRPHFFSSQVIGGELQERLIPVPYSKSSTDQAIRVVNAFRQGLDARYGEHSNTSLAEVLRKQTSLSKRLSQTSSIEYADNIPDELTIPEIDVERLSSHSHTETAV